MLDLMSFSFLQVWSSIAVAEFAPRLVNALRSPPSATLPALRLPKANGLAWVSARDGFGEGRFR